MDAKPLKPKDDYKTFSELAEYARQRAKISAARNGHQEFAYWIHTAQWADEQIKYDHDRAEWYPIMLKRSMESVARYSLMYGLSGTRSVTDEYARAVHLRKMLINRGEKVGRLSLAWLREMAESL